MKVACDWCGEWMTDGEWFICNTCLDAAGTTETLPAEREADRDFVAARNKPYHDWLAQNDRMRQRSFEDAGSLDYLTPDGGIVHTQEAYNASTRWHNEPKERA